MAMYNAEGDIPLSGFSHYSDSQVGTFQPSDHRIPRRPVGNQNSSPLLSEPGSQYNESDHDSIYAAKSQAQTLLTEDQGRRYEFVRWRQLIRLLAWGVLRLLCTIILSGALYAAFRVYSFRPEMADTNSSGGLVAAFWGYNSRPPLDNTEKRYFNFMITALSMALGMNLASAFKSVALNARWWILSQKLRPLKEIDDILRCESLSTVIAMVFRSVPKGKWTALLVCLAWLLINIIAQTAVAILGLNYSMGSAIDASYPVPGGIFFTNMTKTFGGSDINNSSLDQITPVDQLAAHMYGGLSLVFTPQLLNVSNPNILPVVPVTLYSETQADWFIADTYSQYVFQDWPADTSIGSGSFYSNRSVIATSTCTVYPVTQGFNGSSNSFTYQNGSVVSPNTFDMIGPNSTTYYTSPSSTSCGPRCATVGAFENNGTAGFFYECQVTIGKVTNATVPAHQIPDRNAKMAAGSIALQGYQSKQDADQYQRYPADVFYGYWLAGNETEMAYMIRQYAIGAIAGVDKVNPNIASPVQGLVPRSAVTLKLDHPDFILGILAGIIGGHLVLYVLGIVFANKVIVIDDAYIAVALVLRPVVDRVVDNGCVLLGDKLYAGAERVKYGAKSDDSGLGLRKLEISGQVNSGKDWEGYYD